MCRGQKGFSPILLIVIIGMISVAMLEIFSLRTQLATLSRQATTRAQVDLFRRNLASLVLGRTSWRASVLNGSNTACLRLQTPCTVDGSAAGAPVQNQILVLRDGSGQIFYDPTRATSGITHEGLLCDTFDAVNGNIACPLRYEIFWSASCAPGDCVDPEVRVRFNLLYEPGTVTFPFNPGRYTNPDLLRAAQ